MFRSCFWVSAFNNKTGERLHCATYSTTTAAAAIERAKREALAFGFDLSDFRATPHKMEVV